MRVIVSLIKQIDLWSLGQEGWSDTVSSQFRHIAYPAFHAFQSAWRYHSLKSSATGKGATADNLHRLWKCNLGQRRAILKSTGTDFGNSVAYFYLFKIAFITPCARLDCGALKRNALACAVNHCGIHKVRVFANSKCHSIKKFYKMNNYFCLHYKYSYITK